MSTKINSDFILLSRLIKKIEDKEYYQTYAKSLLMTNRPDIPTPPDEKLVEEMFLYFIQTDNLKIYYKNDEISLTDLEDKIIKRKTSSGSSLDNEELTCLARWENEIYIKAKELKKLYANKCIVIPNSLLRECANENV